MGVSLTHTEQIQFDCRLLDLRLGEGAADSGEGRSTG